MISKDVGIMERDVREGSVIGNYVIKMRDVGSREIGFEVLFI
jgi:hypothetical protein